MGTMMDEPMTVWLEAVVLATTLLASCFALTFAVRCLRAARRDQQRFRFFAVRDRLYTLAARGELPVDSETFRVIRTGITGLIKGSDEVGAELYRLVERAELLRQGKEKTNEGDPDPFIARASHETLKECAALLAELMDAMFILGRLNSRLFRLMLWLQDLLKTLTKTKKLSDAEALQKARDTAKNTAELPWPVV